MIKFIQIETDYKSRERQILNTILTLATGILTLIYPDFLYLIAGGYLVSLGVLFYAFRLPALLAAFPLVTGILIFIFPELIPLTLGIFLILFGLIFFFSFSLSILGILTLAIGIAIYFNPDSVAYLIAAFMLIYSVNNLMQLVRGRGKD